MHSPKVKCTPGFSPPTRLPTHLVRIIHCPPPHTPTLPLAPVPPHTSTWLEHARPPAQMVHSPPTHPHSPLLACPHPPWLLAAVHGLVGAGWPEVGHGHDVEQAVRGELSCEGEGQQGQVRGARAGREQGPGRKKGRGARAIGLTPSSRKIEHWSLQLYRCHQYYPQE